MIKQLVRRPLLSIGRPRNYYSSLLTLSTCTGHQIANANATAERVYFRAYKSAVVADVYADKVVVLLVDRSLAYRGHGRPRQSFSVTADYDTTGTVKDCAAIGYVAVFTTASFATHDFHLSVVSRNKTVNWAVYKSACAHKTTHAANGTYCLTINSGYGKSATSWSRLDFGWTVTTAMSFGGTAKSGRHRVADGMEAEVVEST